MDMKTPPSRSDRPAATSTPDRVVNAINEGIIRRRYSIGQRLVESDLTRDLKVSRGTVREALKTLSAEGVVKLTPHRGAFIRSLSRKEANDLLVVLEVLCGVAARLAAKCIGRGDNLKQFKVAERAITGLRNGAAVGGFAEERARFYQTMLKIGGNAELERVMPLAHIYLFRTQFQGLWSDKDIAAVFKEYQEVATAVLAGDVTLAESRMRRHIRKTGERMGRLPDSAFAVEEEARD